MPSTIIEKILAHAAGVPSVSVGDVVETSVDMTVLIDIQFGFGRVQDVVRVPDPDKVAIVLDHAVPAPGVIDAESGRQARDFAAAHGITRFFDVGRHGIVHQIIAENSLALPGQLVACADSHTCAAGALNTAARGLGHLEILQILCTGKTWHSVPRTIRYDFEGQLPDRVGGKDVFLHIAGKWGDATNYALEFGGDGLATIPIADRRTIATQTAEIGADFGIFPTDERLLAYFADQGFSGGISPVAADLDADYVEVRTVDLSSIEPYVGLPGGVINNTAPAAEVGVRIDQAFIGSCANGQLSDIQLAAELLKGRSVAPGVRLIVTPASQQVYLESVRRGYVETLVEAGAVVTNSTCGACFGYHMGVLGPGETCVTSSTRNFAGRMGSPDAKIYMASTATVAWSAIHGVITDPRDERGVAPSVHSQPERRETR